jgi:hypothetical protein
MKGNDTCPRAALTNADFTGEPVAASQFSAKDLTGGHNFLCLHCYNCVTLIANGGGFCWGGFSSNPPLDERICNGKGATTTPWVGDLPIEPA